MPEMDGYEVCQKLKSDSSTRDIPIIFVTAKGDIGDEKRGFESGAVDYIAKPVSLRLVRARVETHLKLRQMQLAVEERVKALEEMVRLREDVEHVVRHDLKAPLNTIIPLSAMLARQQIESDTDRQLLKRIEHAGYKMLNMINNSLDLYKMEMGTYPLRTEAMDLLPLLRTILEEVTDSYIAGDKVSLLRFQDREVTETDTVFAEAESMLCYPMLFNLLFNAFEASPNDAEVEIDIDQQDDYVSITITNQGAVPVSIRDRFFDKFITRGKPGGTGLGTYLARLCAEAQQGTIALECLPDERTRVVVRLPMVAE